MNRRRPPVVNPARVALPGGPAPAASGLWRCPYSHCTHRSIEGSEAQFLHMLTHIPEPVMTRYARNYPRVRAGLVAAMAFNSLEHR